MDAEEHNPTCRKTVDVLFPLDGVHAIKDTMEVLHHQEVHLKNVARGVGAHEVESMSLNASAAKHASVTSLKG